MRALQVTTLGQPPTLSALPPDPAPAAGEVRVRIAACGLNFADLLMIDGKYQERPALPFTLGMELSGTVEALGADVAGLAVGARVLVLAGQGGLAEQGCFAANRCLAIPDNVGFEDAAALPIAYGTSHLALARRARLLPGETLLVLGAAGGVGLTAVEIGKLMGARVIAVARGAGKLAVAARAGADHLIDSDSAELTAEVRALGGADVCYDPVGGGLFDAALRAMRPEGRIIPLGFASGTVPQIAANYLLVKNITVIGLYLSGYLSFAPQVLHDSLTELLGWLADGRLKPHISHRLPLDRASEALELLRARKSTGKVVVTMA